MKQRDSLARSDLNWSETQEQKDTHRRTIKEGRVVQSRHRYGQRRHSLLLAWYTLWWYPGLFSITQCTHSAFFLPSVISLSQLLTPFPLSIYNLIHFSPSGKTIPATVRRKLTCQWISTSVHDKTPASSNINCEFCVSCWDSFDL